MATDIAPDEGDGLLYWQQVAGVDPGYAAIDDRRARLHGLQEGVVEAGSYAVTQRAAGVNMSVDIAANLGFALVEGDSINFQGLYTVPPHSVTINEAITAAHGSLPRIDRVVLEVQDDTWDASGENRARTRILDGTATSGATLNNLTGAATVADNQLLLADVLVGAGVTSISNSVIRDRRKWARGAYCSIVRNSNAAAGNDYTTTSGNYVLIDGTNLAPRIECSGVPLRLTLFGAFDSSSVGIPLIAPQIDGVGINGYGNVGAAGATTTSTEVQTSSGSRVVPGLTWNVTPSAGSHVIAPAWASSNGSSTVTLRARAGVPCGWIVEEIIRQNTGNNATSG